MRILNLQYCSRRSKLPMPLSAHALALLICFASFTSSCTEQDRSSLVDFLDGLLPNGDTGLRVSWVHSTDCCKWEGITCSSDGAVTYILLASRGLEGRISPSLSNLTRLLHLNLSHNSLYGSLPMELIFSSSIIFLDVSFNRFSGSMQELQPLNPGLPLQILNISSNLMTGQFLSTTWEAMKNLVALNASNNSFTGQMPSSICIYAPSISMLDLSYNQFSGGISPEFGNCSMLTVLKAGQNKLHGALPHELFGATSLKYLSLRNNDLQGFLDGSSLVKLRNLAVLDLGSTGITGKIPDSIGQLRRLKELHLDNNNMSGELPLALGNCTSLRYISLRNNSFWGDLSKVNFAQLDLRIVDFSVNYFTGEIPESIYLCSNLIALRLAYNNLYGQFSPRIGNLKNLSFLSITNNSFTDITDAIEKLQGCKYLTTLFMGTNFKGETMPQHETFNGFANIQILTIDGCPLNGHIPPWLSKLRKLKVLDLSSNQLTGSIPSWISRLRLLFFIDISRNNLTGSIPTALMNMPMLQSRKNAATLEPEHLELPVYWTPSRQYRLLSAFPTALHLSNNKFTGAIPPEIGQLKGLMYLNFSSNILYGEIPTEICNLTNLQVLDLSNNLLTGALPAALSGLHFLSGFNVSNNNLEGSIPTGAQFDTFPDSSYSGNPNLCGNVLQNHCRPTSRDQVPTLRRKSSRHALVFGVIFGGLAAFALLACFLIARLVYNDHTENLVPLQRR